MEKEDFSDLIHPVKYCFPIKMPEKCQFFLCEEAPFIRCPFCEMYRCMRHFYIDYHLCE